MTEAEVLDILRQGLWTALIISTPILAVALIVGLGIGLLEEAAMDAWRHAVLDEELVKSVCAAPYIDSATSD